MTLSTDNEESILVLEKACKKILDLIDSTDESYWEKALLQSYRQFEILDENHEWKISDLKKFNDYLIPNKNIKSEFKNLIKDVLKGVYQNQYLVKLVEEFSSQHKDSSSYNPIQLLNYSEDQYNEQIIFLICFAFALERLNLILRKDIDLLENFINFYLSVRIKNNFYRFSNILSVIKLHSIQLPVIRFIRVIKKKKIDDNFAKYLLSFNIFEATLVDCFVGHFNNAISSLALIIFSPNYNGLFGLIKKFIFGSPSKFSSDGKGLEMYSPAQKEWSDLYQVWNMALVSQFLQAPYLLTKLFIPSVSHYKKRPGEYMHTRITALFLTLHYLDFAINRPKINIDLKNLSRAHKNFTQLWGKVNKSCAIDYLNLIKRKK